MKSNMDNNLKAHDSLGDGNTLHRINYASQIFTRNCINLFISRPE